jgi:UPF0716 protein FxsA
LRLPLLPLFFIVLPLAEIAGFVVVGSEIGVLATIALIIATTILGSILLRVQGLGAIARMKAAMETGASPGRDMVHGAMIMLAGILLILPGFITDTLGILLFIPAVREAAWRFLSSRITVTTAGTSYSPRSSRTIDLGDDDFSRHGPDQPEPPARPTITHDR